MEELLTETARRAVAYLEGLKTRSVEPTPEALAHLAAFDEPLPETATDPIAVLDLLDTYGSPATVGSAGSRYFGFVTGGVLPAALAANWMAWTWDQNAALFVSSPIAATLETVALRWLLDVLHLPNGTEGAFVTGATMANFTALAAARHRVLSDAGWDVEADGLFAAPPVTVIVSQEAHPTLFKALGLLGFGRQRVIHVPVDHQGRMRSDAFPQINGPTIVCLQAGNVNTGAFDPAHEIIPRVRETQAWIHVDGAFGLWAAASPSHDHLLKGYSEADSWATDTHKWLNVPYDSGIGFVRDPASLRATMSVNAAYLPQGTLREPAQFTPDTSRRARGVEVWAALRSLGRTGLANLIERNCRYAQRAATLLQQAGLEILNEVVLNQVLISFGTDAAHTHRLIEAIQQEGICWAGPTTWQGHPAMRLSVSSWATTDDDIERSVAAILRIARSQR
jgi:glutamate/tyrosine decarboxylase-like PLP-dependent enzyme